jgi:hypothetical protein
MKAAEQNLPAAAVRVLLEADGVRELVCGQPECLGPEGPGRLLDRRRQLGFKLCVGL